MLERTLKAFDKTMKTRKPKVLMPLMPLESATSGIGVYIIKIAEYLSRSHDIEFSVLGFESEKHYLNLSENTKFIPVPERFSNLKANLIWHAALLPFIALRERADILFLPAGNRRMTLSSPASPFKVAATVHDLASFHLPEKYDKFRTFYVTRCLPAAWRRADRIISVSHSTAKDLVKLGNVSEDKIRVIWNGVEAGGFKPMSKQEARHHLPANLPENFILYVARIEHPGKNHIRLVQAYQILRERHPTLQHDLVFAGSDWSGAEQVHRFVQDQRLSEHVHFAGFFPQNLLPYMYASADLFAFPSLFEGFGIPAIEAMAMGLPLVAANRSSLPEVVGNIGILFDPENPKAMADALEQGLFEASFRERFRVEGPQRSQLFSWERSSIQLIEEFRRLSER